jgi:hypothetical protein
MKARSLMLHRIGVSGLGLFAALSLFAPQRAQAQAAQPAGTKAEADEAKDDEEEETPEVDKAAAKPEPVVEGKEGARVDAAIPPPSKDEAPVIPADDQLEHANGFVRAESTSTMQWHGGLEADSTYAGYSDKGTNRPQTFYDMRGRFVVGPTLEYRFGEKKDWFVAARGEMVAWVRETGGYQVNADDVYGQVGKKGLWDLKLGRFQTWRVYHKGGGFDLYTIEDQGACTTPGLSSGNCSIEANNFAPHTYEVNYLYYRESIGKVAVHLYPTPWSGIELAGAFGNAGAANQMGARAAGLVHFSFLRASAAVEYRGTKPGQEQLPTCTNCNNTQHSIGFGGGVELTIKPVAIGVNAAQTKDTVYDVTTGVLKTNASNTRTSLGGYAELDVGSLLIDRGLILGFGLNRTELVDVESNFYQHYQGAAYALFPLGFNDASLKLVVSQATFDFQKANGDGTATQSPTTKMQAARLRFSYPF